MKIESVKAVFCKPTINKMTQSQSFKGESPGGYSGGYSYDDWGESPGGGGYGGYDIDEWGESPGVSRSSSSSGSESPGCGGCSSTSSSRRSRRRRRGESPSFGHKVNASYAINNPEKLLQTRLDFLKIQQAERAKQVSKDNM